MILDTLTKTYFKTEIYTTTRGPWAKCSAVQILACVLHNIIGGATNIERDLDFHTYNMSWKLHWANLKTVDCIAFTSKKFTDGRKDGRPDGQTYLLIKMRERKTNSLIKIKHSLLTNFLHCLVRSIYKLFVDLSKAVERADREFWKNIKKSRKRWTIKGFASLIFAYVNLTRHYS